jgi:hypothetical protein
MVSLAKGAKLLAGGGVASDDQKQAAKAAKMASLDGQMLHPDVLQRFHLDRADFAQWLSDAKAQLDRSQQCISSLAPLILGLCEVASEESASKLSQSFSALKEQLQRDSHDICRVMDDFCRFSSGTHFKPTTQDPPSQEELEGRPAATSPRPNLSHIRTSIKSLIEAMILPRPFVEHMKRFYEADRAVYEKPRDAVLREQDTEYLDRATTLHDNLAKRIDALIEFAELVQSMEGARLR